MGGLKQTIKNIMSSSCRKNYFRMLKDAEQNAERERLQKEEMLMKQTFSLRACDVSFEDFVSGSLPDADVYVVFNAECGMLSAAAKQSFLSAFTEHPEKKLIYANEEKLLCMEKECGKLSISADRLLLPWYKPCYSPETLFSYNYVGNVFAIRKDILEKTYAGKTAYEKVYRFLCKAFLTYDQTEIGNIPDILFYEYTCISQEKEFENIREIEKQLRMEDICRGSEKEFQEMKLQVLKEFGVDASWEAERLLYALPSGCPKVSILIPSKDNVSVLTTCIRSIREKTDYKNYEIIVCDNGSSEENKKQVEELAAKQLFTYLYEPAEFNYSRMNNIAAKKASGELYLLLNDDMEILQENWLSVMVSQVLQAGIGAVGAKLYYPGTKKMQHVGITNSAEDGPIHPCMGCEDERSYHHGRNVFTQNVMGVTGACLLLRKADFEAVGGLDEALCVGYNDVDLCFSLLEQKKRNVIRNDVILYHHESLSRGHDLSEEKIERLNKERKYLYEKHPAFYYFDPYDYVGQVHDFAASAAEEFTIKYPEGPKPANAKNLNYPAGIAVSITRAGKMAGSDAFEIRGSFVVPMVDNATYTFLVYLKGQDGEVYEIPLQRVIRKELTERFADASNVILGGFVSYFTRGQIPSGCYEILVYAKDHSSRRRLLQNTGKIVECV